MQHKMFYVGPKGQQLPLTLSDGNLFAKILQVRPDVKDSGYYSVGKYFPKKRNLQPEDITSLLRDRYFEAACIIVRDTGLCINLINRNLTAHPPVVYEGDWFDTRGYSLHSVLSDSAKMYKRKESGDCAKYIYFTHIQRKSMRRGDKLIPEEIRSGLPEDTVFICYCEQFEEVYPDLSDEPGVYLAYMHFFKRAYRNHIYYPTLRVRTDDEPRPSIHHCCAYLYSDKNINAFRELVLKKRRSIDVEICISAAHREPIIGVETYLAKIIQ